MCIIIVTGYDSGIVDSRNQLPFADDYTLLKDSVKTAFSRTL